MSKQIGNLAINNYLLYCLLKPFIFIYRLYKYYLIPDRVAIKRKFRKVLGYTPDLDNPKTLQEKFQWLKLNDRNPFYTRCADKLGVRDVVVEILGTDKYLIPLYFVTDDYKELTPKNLPDKPFVIKCNHDNHSYKIIREKKNADWGYLKKYYRARLDFLSIFWSNREWPYKGIQPKIMVEKLLENKVGEINEYKFYCFMGKTKCILYTNSKPGEERLFRYLDRDFSPLSTNHKIDITLKMSETVDVPQKVNEMKNVAETIAKKFPYHIRVDFYSVDEQFYIGELTFFDSAGYMEISPDDWAKELSDALVINPNCIHTK